MCYVLMCRVAFFSNVSVLHFHLSYVVFGFTSCARSYACGCAAMFLMCLYYAQVSEHLFGCCFLLIAEVFDVAFMLLCACQCCV